MFQRNTCVMCRLTKKPRAPRSTRKLNIMTMKMKWEAFLIENGLLWYTYPKGSIGGRGRTGAVLNLDQYGGPSGPVDIGFFTRRDKAWVVVRLMDGQLEVESRCFSTWHPSWYAYYRRGSLPAWYKVDWTLEKCECPACASTRILAMLARKGVRESGPGPASLPKLVKKPNIPISH